MYNAIPFDVGWALLDYPSSFEPEVEFRIRERDPSSLEEMQSIEITIEYNIKWKEEGLKVVEKEWAEKIA